MFSRATTLILSCLGALLISAISGTQYLFSAYGPALADRWKFTSVQINTIASAANYGTFLCNPIFGYFADTYGPTRTSLFAAISLSTSFLCLALTYEGTLPPVFFLCLVYLFVTGMASAAGFMSAMTTQAKNFPQYRGVAIGAPLALFGLSAFIFSEVEQLVFRKDMFRFLLFLSISTGGCAFIASLLLKIVPPSDTTGPQSPRLQEEAHSSQACDDSRDASSSIGSPTKSINSESTPLLRKQHISSDNPDIGGWDLFCNADAQVMFLVLLFMGGSGLMYINNVGEILKSLFVSTKNPPRQHTYTIASLLVPDLQSLQNFHVSLLSIFSCIGRISAGLFSDITKHVFGMRRLWYLVLSSICLFLGHFNVAFFVTSVDTLWVSTALIGFGYGSMFGIATAVASEWFGLRRFGSNWGFLSAGAAIGGQLLNLLFGFNKDLHSGHCSGANCYNQVFRVSSTGCLLSCAMIVYLLWRKQSR